jgi:RNA-directed DNA polymerase
LDTDTVNGPKDVPDWDAITWRAHEEQVARLRRRIFKATREQRWAMARSLQKMMLRSWSNTLLSVRQVTQRNTGRRTAGVDGEVALCSYSAPFGWGGGFRRLLAMVGVSLTE